MIISRYTINYFQISYLTVINIILAAIHITWTIIVVKQLVVGLLVIYIIVFLVGFVAGLGYINAIYFLVKDPMVSHTEKEYFSIVSNIAVGIGSFMN